MAFSFLAAGIGLAGSLLGGRNRPEQVRETELEREAARLAADQWNQYIERGVPLENEYIARTTGIRIDPDSGLTSLEAGPFSPLLEDGSIRTDSSTARTANEAAATNQLYGNTDPNRANASNIRNDQSVFTEQSIGTDMSTGFQQQDNYLQGVQNVASIGQGRQVENLTTTQQLSAQAQDDAIRAASNAQARSQNNRAAVGQLVGAGATVATNHFMNQTRPLPRGVDQPVGVGGGAAP